MAAEGVCLDHVALETCDVPQLSTFYQEVLGLESIKTTSIKEFKVVWLRVPASSFSIHIIQRGLQPGLPLDPGTNAQGQRALHGHICFSVSNYGSFLQALKERGIEVDEQTRRGRQVALFSDPDGNVLEIVSSDAV